MISFLGLYHSRCHFRSREQVEMKMKRAIGGICVLLSCAVAFCQQHQDWTARLVPVNLLENMARDIPAKIERIQREAASGEWKEDAEPIYKAAGFATRSLLSFETSRLNFRSTGKDQAGSDVLFVAWDVTIAGKSGLFLRDSCITSDYFVRLHDASTDWMLSALPKLAVPQHFRASIDIRTAGADSYFSLEAIGSSHAFVHDYELRGGTNDGDWLIELRVGKGLLSNFYGRTVWVAERFPPLSDQIRSWSLEKISSQLSSQFHGRTDRDEILIAELVKRKPAPEILSQLIRRVATNRLLLDVRFGQIVGTLYAVDPRWAEEFQFNSLREFIVMGPVAEDASMRAFPATCSHRFESLAVDLVGTRTLMKSAFAYLAECGSEEALAAVQASSPTRELEFDKNRALSAMRSRFQSDPGRPRP